MTNDQVVVVVTVAEDRLRLFRKSGVVRWNKGDRRISISFATRFDLRRVFGATERAVLSDFYGIEPSSITFVDTAGQQVDLS